MMETALQPWNDIIADGIW